jgi:beta-phosphoglucomutase-like phosphatase (HAD superfamily)
LEAAKRLHVVPGKNVLVFEDALNGVHAARAAGKSFLFSFYLFNL